MEGVVGDVGGWGGGAQRSEVGVLGYTGVILISTLLLQRKG